MRNWPTAIRSRTIHTDIDETPGFILKAHPLIVQLLEPAVVLRIFHELEDVFNRIEHLMDKASILPARYL